MMERQQIGPVVKFRMARDLPRWLRYHTACYWVDGLFIDTGCANRSRQLLLAATDLQTDQVVNTHCHEDHIGANAALQALGARVSCHPLAIPYLAEPRRLRLHPYRHLFWGTPAPSTAVPVGEVVRTPHHTFRVIETPGHSPDSICLYEPNEGWLFSGDAYVGGLDRALRVGFHIYQIIDSLKAVAALPLSRIFPGSGSVVEEPGPTLARKIAYLEETGAKVRGLAAGGRSVSQIRQEVFGAEMMVSLVTLGDMSGANLVRSYLSAEDEPAATDGGGGSARATSGRVRQL